MPDRLAPSHIRSLPAWIYDHPGYARLKGTERLTLYVLAWAADRRPDAAGNLVGIRGGHWLVAAVGDSRGRVWKALAKLQSLGFLVTTHRGGGRPRKGETPIANEYRIPGQPPGNMPPENAPTTWTSF